MEEENIINPSSPAEPKYNFTYNMPNKKSNKTTLMLAIILLVILLTLGFFFRSKIKGLFGGAPSSTPSLETNETFSPSPSPAPLVRSDWSLEVLNGSGVSGLARGVAAEFLKLGYSVVKTGNADKQTYDKTEILVRKDFMGKVDLIVADLRDVIKIASVAGELSEGTASARIIIGKDSI